MSDINIEGNMWTAYLTDQVEILTGNSSTVVGGFLSFVTLGGSIDLTIGAAAAEVNVAGLLLDVNMGYQLESSAGGGFEKNLSPLGTQAPGLEYIGTTEVMISSPPSTITLEPDGIFMYGIELTIGGDEIVVSSGTTMITIGDAGIEIESNLPIEIASTAEITLEAPEIIIEGELSIEGAVTITGELTLLGDMTIDGDIEQAGMLTIAGTSLFE